MTLIRVWHLERAMDVLKGGPPCLFLYNEGHLTWVPGPPLSSHASFPRASSGQEGLELAQARPQRGQWEAAVIPSLTRVQTDWPSRAQSPSCALTAHLPSTP